MAPQAEMEIAPIEVHYDFWPYLRICRNGDCLRTGGGGAGRRRASSNREWLGEQLKSNCWQTIAASFYLLLMSRKNYKEKTFQAKGCLLRSVYA